MNSAIPDGRYAIEYGTWGITRTATITMQNAHFAGCTSIGIALDGWAWHDTVRGLVRYEFTVALPPMFQTLTGLTTGENGRNIRVNGETTPGMVDKRFSIEFAGRAIDIALRYVSPLTADDHLESEPQFTCPNPPPNVSSSPMWRARMASAVMSSFARIRAIRPTSARTDH